MRMLFLYGPAAAGKLTVARAVAERTGFALFHNHLIVDALLAVFPFGSDEFVALRERFWIDTFRAAARAGRPLAFTFCPEPTVDAGFPERARAAVEAEGGTVTFVRLDVAEEEQERRLAAPARAEFGKLRDLELFRALKPGFDAAMAEMPPPALAIDTTRTAPDEAAERIAALLAAEGP